jgi:hypothetical protein
LFQISPNVVVIMWRSYASRIFLIGCEQSEQSLCRTYVPKFPRLHQGKVITYCDINDARLLNGVVLLVTRNKC